MKLRVKYVHIFASADKVADTIEGKVLAEILRMALAGPLIEVFCCFGKRESTEQQPVKKWTHFRKMDRDMKNHKPAQKVSITKGQPLPDVRNTFE